jgi:hypothetical protein
MLISSLRTTLRLESSLFSARWPLSSTPTTPLDGSIHRSFLERLLYIEKRYWHTGIGSYRSPNCFGHERLGKSSLIQFLFSFNQAGRAASFLTDQTHTDLTTPERLHRPNYTTPPTTATPAIFEGNHTSPSSSCPHTALQQRH